MCERIDFVRIKYRVYTVIETFWWISQVRPTTTNVRGELENIDFFFISVVFAIIWIAIILFMFFFETDPRGQWSGSLQIFLVIPSQDHHHIFFFWIVCQLSVNCDAMPNNWKYEKTFDCQHRPTTRRAREHLDENI